MLTMSVRVGSRIEVRLDEKHRKMLEKVLAESGDSVSAFFRRRIEQELEEIELGERLAAALRLCSIEEEVPRDPEELNRRLDAVHDPGVREG
jgi:hypothetical protein